VVSAVRKLFAVLAVVALFAPAASGLCAVASARHCTASQHACCEGPRVVQCDCADPNGSGRQSEPAQRFASVNADNTLTPVALDRPRATALSSRQPWLDASPPPGAISERLSLLSTLLI
jgi:hypothetical protein